MVPEAKPSYFVSSRDVSVAGLTPISFIRDFSNFSYSDLGAVQVAMNDS